MDNDAKQFTCECGKRFSNRNELDQHRQNCATAQAAGQQVRGAGGSRETNQ
jgi:hypothetical protein